MTLEEAKRVLSRYSVINLIGEGSHLMTSLEGYIDVFNMAHDDFCELLNAINANYDNKGLKIEIKTIDHDTAIALTDMIKDNKTLISVQISTRKLEHNVCLALASALEKNSIIKRLEIFASLTIESEIALARALENNKTVKRLWFMYCYRNDESICALAVMLKQNTTLTSIHLSGSTSLYEPDFDTTARAMSALCEALETNMTLTDLHLSGHESHVSNNRRYVEFYKIMRKRVTRNNLIARFREELEKINSLLSSTWVNYEKLR